MFGVDQALLDADAESEARVHHARRGRVGVRARVEVNNRQWTAERRLRSGDRAQDRKRYRVIAAHRHGPGSRRSDAREERRDPVDSNPGIELHRHRHIAEVVDPALRERIQAELAMRPVVARRHATDRARPEVLLALDRVAARLRHPDLRDVGVCRVGVPATAKERRRVYVVQIPRPNLYSVGLMLVHGACPPVGREAHR
ncbi:MAG TPA: hypothetical protein VGF81_16310 [Solirubrobacteraceae bacterium]